MSKLLKSYKDFRDGLNTDAAPDNVLDSELLQADNVDLLDRGGIRSRNGTERLNKDSYNFPIEQLIEWPSDSGDEILLAVVKTEFEYNNLCLVNGKDYTLTVLTRVNTDKCAYFYLRNKLYILDGTKYFEYDGETISEIYQPDKPTTALNVESASYPSTAPIWTFEDPSSYQQYVNTSMKGIVTFVDNFNRETPGSPIVGGDETIIQYYTLQWSNIPTGPTGTKKRRLYRTAYEHDDSFHLVAEINNNTTTTFEDKVFKADLAKKRAHISIIEPGHYQCAYTLVSAEGYESEPSPVETVVVSPYNEIKWTIPVGPEGTKERRLYRTEANGSVLKHVHTINGNTATEFHDYISELGEPMTADNNLDDIRKCKYACYHYKSMRLFFGGNPNDPSAIYFSEYADPYKVLNTSVLYPTTGDGPLTGLNVYGDSVLAHYDNNSIWKYAGLDPEDDAVWVELPTGVSSVSQHTINLTPNSLSFLGQGGWFALNPLILHYGMGMQPGEEVVRNLAKKKVEKIIRGINLPEKAVSVFDARRQRSLLAYTDEDAARNNKILVYDWGLGSFTRYDNIQANDLLCRLNGDILIATNNYILRFTDRYIEADGKPVKSVIRTKQYNLDYPYHKKRLTRLFMSLKNPMDVDAEITARIYVDDKMVTEILESTFADSFIWGDPWGGRWGTTSLVTTRSRVSESGHRIQVEIIHEQYDEEKAPEDAEFVLYGLAFEYRPSRAKGNRL